MHNATIYGREVTSSSNNNPTCRADITTLNFPEEFWALNMLNTTFNIIAPDESKLGYEN